MKQPKITEEEKLLLEEWAQKLAPGYRMFNMDEFKDAMERAVYAQRENLSIMDRFGRILVPHLVHWVIRDPAREGYGVPFIWWWIYFESQIFTSICQDTWSEVKWWLWDELRGKGKTLTMHGSQNCLAVGTKVMMADGSLRAVEDVLVGDLVMGDDSTPRMVLSTCRGVGPMVKVIPKMGEPFVCTSNHKLSLVCKRGKKNNGGKSFSTNATPGAIYDIEAEQVLGFPTSRLGNFGLYYAAIELPPSEQEFDPYIYGIWLGDGDKCRTAITNPDKEIVDSYVDYFGGLGYRVAVSDVSGAKKVYISTKRRTRNPFRDFINGSVDGSKFIRPEYLNASITQRLRLLAGLIDSDGYLSNGCSYVISCSDPKLMDGYVELTKSLGFKVYRNKVVTNYTKKDGTVAVSETLNISGKIEVIPVRVPRKRKQPKVGRGVRKHGVTGFTVERHGIGEYAGFELDGNSRFVDGNYCVHHNSSKSSWMGRFAITQLIAWTSDAHFYVAGPYKLHSEDKAWQSLSEWVAFINTQKSLFYTFLGVKIESQKQVIMCTNLKTQAKGEARFVSIDDASSIQGKKSANHDPMLGITCVIVDEFIENTSLKLKQADSNIASNNNYFGILACNPLPEKVQHPAVRPFSAPVDVAQLNREHHFRWRTAYGVCTRFAWLNCPNRILGRSEYKYLLTEERMNRAREKGNDAIDAQVDAWGWGGGSKGAPLDEAAIKLAGTYVEPIWQSAAVRVMVVDCAFGGTDPATATIGEVGEILVRARDGNAVTKKSLAGVDQIILPVRADMEVTQEWLDEMDQLLAYSGGNWPQTVAQGISDISVGDQLGGAWDMAYQTLRTMRDYNVPPGNVAFDSSQRGDCTSIMLSCLGHNNVRWFYEGSRKIVDEENLSRGWWKWPYQYQETAEGVKEPIKWSSVVSQTISMVWLFACEAIKGGMLCNGITMKKGLDELCARPIVRSRQGQGEGKKDVLGKEKLKDMGQKSPTYGEGLAMLLYFSTRFLGLLPLGDPVKNAVNISPTLTIQASSIITGGNNRRVSAGWFR
jgi:hypothetical protein